MSRGVETMAQVVRWSAAALLCLSATGVSAETGRSLRSVSPDNNNQLVYEYDAPKGAPSRLTIDTSSILKDVDRSQKRKSKKKTAEPQASRANVPAIEQASMTASVAPEPAALIAPAPPADRKVRVIPLYNVPQN